ncbi:MAG: lamin tail domain-containing protein [Pedosphaera sp.]|nr:lamin tail domain-containing protein [Pedosphaera sp.]
MHRLGTQIPGGGFLVLDERQFGRAQSGTNGFQLSSHGDEIYLFSADASDRLTGFAAGFAFGASANGVSLGRHTNSIGEISWPAQPFTTLGLANVGPKIPAVVFNEILFNPLPGEPEFIELRNTTDLEIPLFDPLFPTNTWRILGTDFRFPSGVILPPHGLVLITSAQPEAARLRFSLPQTTALFGPMEGALANEGEQLELQRPDLPDTLTNAFGVVTSFIPNITVDSVRYRSRLPWPIATTTVGTSLERRSSSIFSDDPTSWFASLGDSTPGTPPNGNRPPRITITPLQPFVASSFPTKVRLSAIVTDDGEPGPVSTLWSRVSGSSLTEIITPSKTDTEVSLPGIGTWVFKLTATDGDRSVSEEITVQVPRPLPGQITLLPALGNWRYLDSGAAPSSDWITLGFSDTSWKSSATEFGYGDGDEATVLSFGSDANAKRITYYFRRDFALSGTTGLVEAALGLVRDDGAVVYLNGKVVSRQNLPEGDIGPNTLAVTAVGGADETTFFESPLVATGFREGRNVVAVEIHQSSPSSSDISFNLTLSGRYETTNQPPSITALLESLNVSNTQAALLRVVIADDGLPTDPGVPVVHWDRLSGPGSVVFSATNQMSTSALFDTPAPISCEPQFPTVNLPVQIT